MPEAVIVSTARSPIGRAFKGSLVGVRPDDLAAQMVAAALDRVPELEEAEVIPRRVSWVSTMSGSTASAGRSRSSIPTA